MENGQVVTIPETEFEIICDTVILATGQSKRTGLFSQIDRMETDQKGRINVRKENLQTTNPKYFTGGDAMNGGAEVVKAVAEGKRAAKGIHSYIGTLSK